MERSILIVEDDTALRHILAEQLAEGNSFFPVGVASLSEADARLDSATMRFDTVILDVGLPDGDGRDYCAKLRRQGHKMPIIMLTDTCAETDVVRGLDSGANDYVAKPYRPQELMARIRSQLRSFESSEHAVFTVGPFLFRPAARLLLDPKRSRRIHLTSKEAGLLRCLHRARDRIVDRQELLDEVWGYNASVTTHTLETHVYRLRQKIESDPTAPSLLITHRKGYRLVEHGTAAGA